MDRKELINVVGSERAADNILSKSFIYPDFKKPFGEWRKTLVGAFISEHPDRVSVLSMMCEAIGKKSIKWSDCTKLNLRHIAEYINSKVSPNSAATYIHIIGAFLREYSEENILPVKELKKGVMRTKTVPSQHVALTIDELEKFNAYVPKNTMEADIKVLFMRAAYTGARCSDAEEMSMANVHGNILSYISDKTKIESDLPIHKNLPKYLKYTITKKYCSEQTRRVIHKICRTIGMTEKVSLYVNGRIKTGEKWEFCSMHTARRSFCSVLAALGVPVETIRAMAGHTTSAMTDRYIVVDSRRPGKEAMAFFNAQTA